MEKNNYIAETADIISAYFASNKLAADDVAKLVESVHQALSSLRQEQGEPEKKEPAVSVRASVRPDYLVCLACGAKQKTLKRHLQTAHGLTPDDYRQAFGLPSSYPMVTKEYADRRRELAKQIGLGRKPGQPRGRRKKS